MSAAGPHVSVKQDARGRDGRREWVLAPGAMVVTRDPGWIRTTLGSCVAVCLFHRAQGFAAMCHGVLPRAAAWAEAETEAGAGRFVDSAVAAMLAQARVAGLLDGTLQAKVFGGAQILRSTEVGQSCFEVGAHNARVAEEVLAAAGVAVVARDIGGFRGRQIQFCTTSGEVRLRHLLAQPRRLR